MIRAEVVDASAIVAITFAEPGAEALVRQLDGRRLLAPALMRFEAANALWVKARRNPEQRENLFAQFRDSLDVPIETCDVDLEEASSIGLEHGLTVYDACYVWLAMSRDAGLVTLDRQMARVASVVGIR